jgi:hypothetical protein
METQRTGGQADDTATNQKSTRGARVERVLASVCAGACMPTDGTLACITPAIAPLDTA